MSTSTLWHYHKQDRGYGPVQEAQTQINGLDKRVAWAMLGQGRKLPGGDHGMMRTGWTGDWVNPLVGQALLSACE
jgi:hypothetical protein